MGPCSTGELHLRLGTLGPQSGAFNSWVLSAGADVRLGRLACDCALQPQGAQSGSSWKAGDGLLWPPRVWMVVLKSSGAMTWESDSRKAGFCREPGGGGGVLERLDHAQL